MCDDGISLVYLDSNGNEIFANDAGPYSLISIYGDFIYIDGHKGEYGELNQENVTNRFYFPFMGRSLVRYDWGF